MLKKYKFILALVTIVLIFYGSASAGEDTKVNADPLSCSVDNNLVFRIDVVSTADKYPDTVINRFFLVNRNVNDSLVHLEAKIKWTPSEVTLVSWAKDIGWPSSITESSSVVTDSTLYFSINFNNYLFDSTKAVLKMTFHTGCYPLNDTADVTFKTDQCVENSVGRPGQEFTNYHPNSSSFRKGGPILAVTPNANMTNFESQTIECEDTVIVPIMYNSNITASAGFVAKWKWGDDSLKFVRVEQNGTLTQGKNLDTAVWNPDSVMVTTSDNIPRRLGSDTTLMKLIFVYKSASDDILDTVVHTIDTVKTTCQYAKDANSCSGANCKFYAVIPQYSANIYFKNMSLSKNTSGQLKEELTNTFTVDMDETDADSIASFRVDTTTFDWIRWNGSISTTFNSGNLTFKWKKFGVLDYNPTGFMVKEDIDNESDSIPKTDTKREICHVGINALSTEAEDFVQFTREASSGQDLYKRDSKLKSYNRSIVRYSFTGTGIDSLFRLQGGTVTVTGGGGGGSCPFLYVWNGNSFEEDNTILTQTEFSAPEQTVTDYYLVQKPLVAKNDQYHLQLKELTEEKSFIDQIGLLTVDHPFDQKIAVTPEGKILYTERELAPVSAVDDGGEDQLAKLLTKDDLFYTSEQAGFLELVFPNSENKLKGKMVFGTPTPTKFPVCGPPGGGGRVSPDNPREPKLELIKTEIQDINGEWIELAQAPPRDNYALNYWLVDPNQIQLGSTFKVRISWQKSYSADEIKFYFVSDQTPVATILAPISVSHSNSGSVIKLLTAEDWQFATLVKGEKLDLFFPAENLPLPEGYTRDFIVKASGYYIPYAPEPAALIPDRFELKDNYPNPFNAVTEIQYALPEPSEVNLSVYNIMGQKVSTLMEGRQSAGVHSATWDGRNEKGETVASGVYFYTLRARTYIETKKMTLLK